MLSPKSNERYRILSLDGGGSWAIIEAMAIGELFGYDTGGHQILQQVDMAIANSGGSLVLAALVADFSPNKIIGIFKTQESLSSIFNRLKWYQKSIPELLAAFAGIGPRYSTKKKREGFEKELGPTSTLKMSEIPKHVGNPTLQVLIINFDYQRKRSIFFRSNKLSWADSHYYKELKNAGVTHHGQPQPQNNPGYTEVKLVDTIHGSSNAPVNFFNEPASFSCENQAGIAGSPRMYWDGAVGGYNNPVLAGVIEAISNGVPVDRIKILSLGTATERLVTRNADTYIPDEQIFFYEDLPKSSLFKDVSVMANSILSDPPDAASFHAYLILNPNLMVENKNLFRLNPLIKPVKYGNGYRAPEGLSDLHFKRLVEMEMDAAVVSDVAIIEKLAQSWINGYAENQPIRDSEDRNSIIGHSKFTAALEDIKRYY